jgi:XisH protein
MAKDKFHQNVRTALEKDGWTITHDPLRIQSGDVKGEVDLGAEKMIAAEKNGQRIAVEIKSFANPSHISEFETALGQISIYRWILKKEESEYVLFLAIPQFAFDTFFQKPLITEIIHGEKINLLIFNHLTNTVESWKNW